MEFLLLIPVVAITAFIAIRLARRRTARAESPSPEVAERLAALEGGVQGLQQELAEAQERLDFAERMLSKQREERRIGG